MKRGLITWDKAEIPAAVFERRVDRVRHVLAERDLSALVVYSELWRSNQARFFSNYMPYFNRALLVIPRDLPATLLCGLSPRVYGWIRSVTTIEDVRPAGNFAKALFEIAAERNWKRIGALDFPQFPYDIYKALNGGAPGVVNVESPEVFVPTEDETEIAMRKKAADMVKRVLDEEMPAGAGKVDHHFVGQLERRFRRAGAEDLIVLLTNGATVPAPPCGAVLKEGYSVSIALEYRGHWVRVPDNAEFMWGSYPYECH
jgi:Xaa-Pro aminopeptidase